MQSFKVTAANARLRYHDLPGHNRPLIFLHGLGCASSCDYPQVAGDPALVGRRMILVDLLGSGFSDRPEEFGYTIADHACSVVELVHGLGFGCFDLFGHSMGGAVAIVAAGMLRDRLGCLVLSEPNLIPGGGVFSRKIAAMNEHDFVAVGHDSLARSSQAQGSDIWAASLSVTAPYAVHRGARSLVEGSHPTWREMLVGLSVPRTVIFGEKSLPDPELTLLPQDGVGVAIVADAGHSMAWENPSGLARAIQDALSQQSVSSS